jgi:hypothetical protein
MTFSQLETGMASLARSMVLLRQRARQDQPFQESTAWMGRQKRP